MIAAGADYFAAQLVDAAAPGLVGGIGDLGGEQARKFARDMEPELRQRAHAELKQQIADASDRLLVPPTPNPVEDDPRTWGVPDPVFLAHPAVLYLRLTPGSAGNTSLARGTWSVEPSGVFHATTFDVAFLPTDGMTVPVCCGPPYRANIPTAPSRACQAASNQSSRA